LADTSLAFAALPFAFRWSKHTGACKVVRLAVKVFMIGEKVGERGKLVGYDSQKY
jgi:hypothetical protein